MADLRSPLLDSLNEPEDPYFQYVRLQYETALENALGSDGAPTRPLGQREGGSIFRQPSDTQGHVRRPTLGSEALRPDQYTDFDFKPDTGWTDADERQATTLMGNRRQTETPQAESRSFLDLAQGIGGLISDANNDFWQAMFKASAPDATPEDRLNALVQVGLLHVPGANYVRSPGGSFVGMFTGARGARALSEAGQAGEAVASTEARQVPRLIFESIEAASQRGVPDEEIVRQTRQLLAGYTDNIEGAGRISDLFAGVSRGADGQWRLELSDAGMRFTPTLERWFTRDEPLVSTIGKSFKLSDVVDHPALFEMYPHLRDMNINIRSTASARRDAILGEGRYGGKAGPGGVILWADTPQMARRILTHELQHMIQVGEGFGLGARYINIFGAGAGVDEAIYMEHSALGRMLQGDDQLNLYTRGLIRMHTPPGVPVEQVERLFLEQINATAHRRFSDFDLSSGAVVTPPNFTTLEEAAKYMREHRELFNFDVLKEIGANIDKELYGRTAGEVEARLAHARMDMSAEERRATSFEDTPGAKYVGLDDQIARAPLQTTTSEMAGGGSRPPGVPRNDAVKIDKAYNPTPEEIASAISMGFRPPHNPVTPWNVREMLDELGLEIHSQRVTGDGTIYITFRDPRGRSLDIAAMPRIRIPRIGTMHTGHVDVREQGMLFDTTWDNPGIPESARLTGARGARTQTVASHRLDENGRAYADIDVLREALMKRFRPDMLPEEAATLPSHITPDPRQGELPLR